MIMSSQHSSILSIISCILLASHVSQSLPSSEKPQLGKRYDLGPFDKGTQFETTNRAVTIEVPRANFCGNEKLNGVAQRLNPKQTYNPSFNDYLTELRKAGIYQRKEMLLANLNKALDAIPKEQCASQMKQDANRQLSELRGATRAWIVTLVKVAGFAASCVAINASLRGFVEQAPPVDQAFILALIRTFQTVILYPIVTLIIEDINNRLPRQLTSLDQWEAMAITMLTDAVRNIAGLDGILPNVKDPQNTLVTVGSSTGKRAEPNCTAFGPEETERFLHQASLMNGGSQLPIRPYTEVKALHDVKYPNACPDHFVEIGSGEVAG